MIKQSVSNTVLVDYEVVKYVLTKLPRISGVTKTLKHEVLELIIDNAKLLYPVAEQMAKYVISFNDLPPKEKQKIGRKLLNPLKKKHDSPPPYYAMWILYIFSTSEDWNNIKDIIEIYQNSHSEIVKRYAALAVARVGTRSEALVIRDDFSSASDLLKLAILEASRKLGKDERKFWKQANQIKGCIEKLI